MRKTLITLVFTALSVLGYSQENLSPFTHIYLNADIGNVYAPEDSTITHDVTNIVTFNYNGERIIKTYNPSRNFENTFFMVSDVDTETNEDGDIFQKVKTVSKDGQDILFILGTEGVMILFKDGGFAYLYNLEKEPQY